MAFGSLLIVAWGVVCRSPAGPRHSTRLLPQGRPSAREHGGSTSPGDCRAGSRRPSWVLAAATVGVVVGVAVGLLVGLVMVEVVLVAHMVRVRHVARMTEIAKVSQVAPAREEPRLGPPDSVSPHCRPVRLHIVVLASPAQAGGHHQQQQNGHSSAYDQAHEA